MILSDKADLCLSGGAEGADLQWGMVAGSAGHGVIHWTFAGHRSRAPSSEIAVLSPEQLAEADEHCKRASKTLRRWFPPKSPFVRNLLRRNWYQVAYSGSCYAVASIVDGQVSGGTAWATQMFIDRHEGAACPCYVFDQAEGYWVVWDGPQGWKRIHEPPTPSGIYAGVGSRELGLTGKLAIRVLLDYRGIRRKG